MLNYKRRRAIPKKFELSQLKAFLKTVLIIGIAQKRKI